MDTFCVLPWVGREINWRGSETHCCLLPQNYDVEQIKQQMLQGLQPKSCQKCWNLEASGLKSDRQVKNSALDFYWNKDLDRIKQQATEGELDHVLMLKLHTSFTCNATCVSCGSYFSSSWANLNLKIDPTAKEIRYNSVDLQHIKQKINFRKLVSLSLLGGEPLYEKKNFELLEHLVDLGNTDVFVSIVTNGSVILTDRQKYLLSKFKNLNFSVSIDGTESVFEYMRFPLKWADLLDNLKFFRELTDNISSNYTLSNLNILYHNTTKQWFEANCIVYSVNPVYNPTWLQPRALPALIKQELAKVLDTQDYSTFIGHNHSELDDFNYELMLKNIRQQDQAKNIKISDYLPAFADLISINERSQVRL